MMKKPDLQPASTSCLKNRSLLLSPPVWAARKLSVKQRGSAQRATMNMYSTLMKWKVGMFLLTTRTDTDA